jgi:hypothetical protein
MDAFDTTERAPGAPRELTDAEIMRLAEWFAGIPPRRFRKYTKPYWYAASGVAEPVLVSWSYDDKLRLLLEASLPICGRPN